MFDAVTSTAAGPPSFGKFLDEYEIEYVHGGGAIAMMQAGEFAVTPELSATEPVKENVPACVGMPVIPPKAFGKRPGGSAPLEIANDV